MAVPLVVAGLHVTYSDVALAIETATLGGVSGIAFGVPLTSGVDADENPYAFLATT